MRVRYFSTFVCPTEIIAFSDRIQEFRNLNTESRRASLPTATRSHVLDGF